MTRHVSLRLATVNAIGFAATTVMPLWLGVVSDRFGMPAWFAGAAVLTLVGSAAAANLLASRLLALRWLTPIARTVLVVAAAGQLITALGSPVAFLVGCLVVGTASGTLLNITNRTMGSLAHVQRSYALFVIIEVCVATCLFVGCSELAARYGPLAMFPALAALTLAGIPILGGLLRLLAPPAAEVTRSGPPAVSAVLGLLALALFFVGQATLNSFMPAIGHAMGLDAASAGRVIGLGMPFGLAGALLAGWLGERVRPLAVIGTAVALLAVAGLLLTATPALPVFAGSVVVLAVSTMLCVPYFFAGLGSHDAHGRYTALGPAMMLAGVGSGPAVAVMLNGWAGLPAVGLFSAVLLFVSGVTFAASTGRAASLPHSRRPA